MAVSINKVYQKVLALANKEQRGYITPQEFNLFADHAQMEIFEQYFYDIDQFERNPSSDMDDLLKQKTQIFKKFQEETNPQVLVIQPQAAAHGVTLTRANTVVWWGPTSSLETYDQANARVHRSGQTHKCTVVQLQGSDAEKHVYRLLDRKINVHTKFVELYKEVLD